MTRVMIFNNTPCIKCNAVEGKMIKVGCIPFCYKDFDEEFPEHSGGVVDSISPKYQQWLTTYKKLQPLTK